MHAFALVEFKLNCVYSHMLCLLCLLCQRMLQVVLKPYYRQSSATNIEQFYIRIYTERHFNYMLINMTV